MGRRGQPLGQPTHSNESGFIPSLSLPVVSETTLATGISGSKSAGGKLGALRSSASLADAAEYLRNAEGPGRFLCRENRWATGSNVFDAFEGPLPLDNVISYGDSIAGELTHGVRILLTRYAEYGSPEDMTATEGQLRWSRSERGIHHICCAACACGGSPTDSISDRVRAVISTKA